MVSKNFPKRVWDFGIKNTEKFIQMIPSAKLNGRTPVEAVTGKPPDISKYVNFDLYDYCATTQESIPV